MNCAPALRGRSVRTVDVSGDQHRLLMPEIVGFGVRRQRSAIQELDVWRWIYAARAEIIMRPVQAAAGSGYHRERFWCAKPLPVAASPGVQS